MKNLILALTVSVGFASFAAPNWGKTGHRTVGEIAAKHLKSSTSKKISALLNNESMAVAAVFADDIKSDSQFNKFGSWHYVNFDGEKKYKEDPINPEGDVLQGIKASIEKIRSDETSNDEKKFYLKLLIHFVGDLHMPLHAGNLADKGGNDVKVKWFGGDSNLHRVWDSDMIDDYQMSYTELATNNDEMVTKAQIEEFEKGTLLEWVVESRQLALKLYSETHQDEKLGYKYMYQNFPIAQNQLEKGGVRLALILNEVFKNKSKWLDGFLADL
ncbi:S1/P1 nuclease [Flavobacterium algicola]|uniref:S1/P1 nuclease n=1 Tax=Flavobacterium algicola TaxID=556529 RepID=UPI001EFEA60C|nr:S1/P1 nuclease [Flavobacterium algicola]MCG9792161.1 S1/P1 nuclease [Flavobacterium algicola]